MMAAFLYAVVLAKKLLQLCYIFLTLSIGYVRIEKDNFCEVKTVDKHEYRLKTEQMLKYFENKDYKEAFEIAESIDWQKVKNPSVLCAVSEIYEYNEEYQKSRDILFLAYDRSPESKKIIYRLGTLALKLGELKEASDCYEEFLAIAPKDPNRHIFKYKILKSKNAPLQEQIEVLEEFKKVEYVEKWAFELAQLYHEAGMITEFLEECDDLILWFSEGEYIYKAMELKMQYKPLTPLQHEKYMSRFGKKEEVTETAEDPILDVEEKKVEDVEPIIQIEGQETKEESEEAEPVIEIPAVEEEQEEQKPSLSLEEIVQDWEEQQKENAQMIQAEFERVEMEKAQNEAEEDVTETEEILSDDLRKLMEELEAESAEIEAQKSVDGLETEAVQEETPTEEAKPLLQKVMEQLEMVAKQEPAIAEEEQEAVAEIEEIEEVEEDEGIKLGDTQSIALSTKALASAAHVDIPQEVIPEIPVAVPTPPPIPTEAGQAPYDTGFVVQGRYDLDAQSEIGLKAGLTEEQKKLFSYFVPVHGMSEQLVKVLHDDKVCKTRYGTSRIGNILVVGRRGSGKTVLAVNIVKAIQKARRMKQGKVAIVTAESLNKKNVAEIVEKLHGGALVIERASRLKSHTIESLCDLMEGQTGELLVVLEDERKPIEKLFAEYPNFKKKFTSRVEIPVFINDELVTFAQTYAQENGYKIDEMGLLALYSDIDMLQREDKIVTVSDVKAIVDDAIENASRASVKKLVKKIFGINRDEADRIILKEEDFR